MNREFHILRKIILILAFTTFVVLMLHIAYLFFTIPGSLTITFWQLFIEYAPILAFPLIGVWVASLISPIDLLVGNIQNYLFKFLTLIYTLSSVHELSRTVPLIFDGYGSISSALIRTLSELLILVILGTCAFWPKNLPASEPLEETFS